MQCLIYLICHEDFIEGIHQLCFYEVVSMTECLALEMKLYNVLSYMWWVLHVIRYWFVRNIVQWCIFKFSIWDRNFICTRCSAMMYVQCGLHLKWVFSLWGIWHNDVCAIGSALDDYLFEHNIVQWYSCFWIQKPSRIHHECNTNFKYQLINLVRTP